MMDNSKPHMVDTMIFNRFCDGVLSLECLRRRRVITTSIQGSELRNTPDEVRRNALLDAFETIRPDWVPAAELVLDMPGAGLDEATFGLNDGTYQAMLTRLQQEEGDNERWTNQVGDVLIAETAMRYGAVLVSDDGNLRKIASEFGVEVMSIEEFARE